MLLLCFFKPVVCITEVSDEEALKIVTVFEDNTYPLTTTYVDSIKRKQSVLKLKLSFEDNS